MSQTVPIFFGYTQPHAIVSQIETGLLQAFVFRRFTLHRLQQKVQLQDVLFPIIAKIQLCRNSPCVPFSCSRKRFTPAVCTVEIWTAVASTGHAVPAQTLRIISRLVCLGVPELAPSRCFFGPSLTCLGFRCSSRERRKRPISRWCHWGQQDSGLAFSSRGAPTCSLRKKWTLQKNQGGRLMEVPPSDWRLLSRDILRQGAEEVIAYVSLPPYAYSEWSGPKVQSWGGGSKLQPPWGGHSVEVVTLWETQRSCIRAS